MVIVNLKGGLGNQMFQYAAGRYLASVHEVPLRVDDTFLKADPAGRYTRRHYELDIFEADIRVATAVELRPFYQVLQRRSRRNFQKLLPFAFRYRYYDERQLSFSSAFERLPANTYLDGYFQSELFFKPAADLIRQDFTFKGPFPDACKAWQQQISATESVSLHVRRGDYVSNPADTTYHGTCPPAYYRAAVDELLAKHPGMELFVFSDDLPWCRQHLSFEVPMHFVDGAGAGGNHLDMLLMSACRHNIIANSSFSWWGAWLNNHPSKTVIAPRQWFGDAQHTHTIIPHEWKRL